MLQTMGSQRVGHDLATEHNRPFHILISGFFKYVWLHNKGKIKFQVELRLLFCWIWDGEIILNYPGTSSVITEFLIGEKEAEDQKKREHYGKIQLIIAGFDDGAKECRKTPEEEKGKDCLLEPQEEHNPGDTSIITQRDRFWVSDIQTYNNFVLLLNS